MSISSLQEFKLVKLPKTHSDFILKQSQRIRILKIDIEGAEIDLLNDLIDTKAIYHCDSVLVETHDHAIKTLVEPTRQLAERLRKEKIRHVYLGWE